MRLRSKIIIVVGTLVMLLVAWVAFQFVRPAPKIIVAKTTTYLTEPLADDGLPDYAGYLLAREKQGVTPETNAAIPLMRAMWPGEMKDEVHQRAFCEEVRMEMPTEVGMSSPRDNTELDEALVSWLEASKPQPLDEDSDFDFDASFANTGQQSTSFLDWAVEQPWTASEIPPLSSWIEAHSAQFKLLHEAAAKPGFYAPSPTLLLTPKTNLINTTLPTMQAVRVANMCLHMRGLHLIGEGRLEEAYEDWQAQLRLARRLKGGFLVGQLISNAAENLANQLGLWILDDPYLDADTARAMLEIYRTLPLRGGVVAELDQAERLVLASSIFALSGQREDPIEGIGKLPKFGSIDWNIPLQMSNEWYDRMVDAAATKPSSSRAAKFAAIHRELEAISARLPEIPISVFTSPLMSQSSRSQRIGEQLVSMMLPACEEVCLAENRINTQSTMMRVAAALAIHRLEHGEYPPTLNLLVPKLIESLPVDHYDGKPLIYRRTEQGYLLYSVGANGKDDGGSNRNTFEASILEGYKVELSGLADTRDNKNIIRNILSLPSVETVDELDWQEVLAEVPRYADDVSIRLPLPRFKLPQSAER